MDNDSLLLYKYVPLEVAALITLSSTLKFTNPENFNDPFDCNISRLKFELSEELDPFFEKEIHEIRKRNNDNPNINSELLERGYKEMQRKKIEKSSICCFSLIPDNPLMWAHYSDKHKGACLIFDYSMKDKYTDIPEDRVTESPVNYLPFTISNFFKDKKEGILTLFATKSIDWMYENEYRHILLEQEGCLKFNPNFLLGIIFGMKVSVEEINSFRSIYESKKVPLVYKRATKEEDKLRILDIS
jgi:hypothetical protein